MLAYLHVKNIALIEELEIDFDKGLNILTGETGAGKSILLGAVNYVLGAKVKKDFIRQGAKEAFVECVFDISNDAQDRDAIVGLLEGYGIEEDENLIISRKTARNGRSVFRINGEVVSQIFIQSVASLLIDIHSQHEHQSLISSSRQLDLLDRFAGQQLSGLMKDYRVEYRTYTELMDSINEELLDDDKRRREIAFLEFEIEEINNGNLEIGEDEKLQHTYDRLSHNRVIMEKLSGINNDLYERMDMGGRISSGLGELQKVADYDEALHPIVESLMQMEDLAGTLNRDMTRYLESMDDYEEELYNAEQRLDAINQLKLKYGDTIEEIFKYLDEKTNEHQLLVNFEENLFRTREELARSREKLRHLSEEMSKVRKQMAQELSEAIVIALSDMNLINSEFEVGFMALKDFTSKGTDRISFMITTNKGEKKKPLKDVASGGELSRIMLAVKSILAGVDGVDTLIFDEIDTGISGKTAQKVAEKMAALAKERQLICITHLPQIASMAAQHFLIHKEVVDETTVTMVDSLDEEASVEEVARMLSGAVTSDLVLANAREMKEYAKKI